ncbi:hypothetical protein BGZ51_001746 [Haplosporangium sp. Z 767]|nr:hypothetical protein BGZ51_001746 [Haplosporangium sp. Z 767]
MRDPTRQPITQTEDLKRRSKIDSTIVQESIGMRNNTVHGIPPFTVPRADGILEASPDIRSNRDGTATARMMRRRQGNTYQGDQDGDGSHTNSQGYRDGNDQNKDGKQGRASSGHGGISGAYGSGVTSRRPFLQRLRKAGMPTLIGGLIAWYFDAVGVLVYRNDPRIKG